MKLRLVHEDLRRTLYEFGEGGNWKVAKYLEIKEDCIVGDHYHKKKDELFLLVRGGGFFSHFDITLPSLVSTQQAITPYHLFIPRNTWHRFELERGSVLICLASELHDPNDDHKI